MSTQFVTPFPSRSLSHSHSHSAVSPDPDPAPAPAPVPHQSSTAPSTLDHFLGVCSALILSHRSSSLSYLSSLRSAFERRLDYLRSSADAQRYFSHSAHSSSQFTSIQHEIASISHQIDCFRLLLLLRPTEERVDPFSTMDEFESPKFSHRSRAFQIVRESPQLARYLAVLDWAEESFDLHDASEIEREGSVAFRRTLRKVQRISAASEAAEQPFQGEGMDIDASLRGNIPFDPLDLDEEAYLLRLVWRFLRSGRPDAAADICRQFRQSWRSASLAGVSLWENPQLLDSPSEVQGNRSRFLWKWVCRQLSDSPQVSALEAAIYASLTGNLPKILPFCHSWEDHLWANLKCYLDRRMDEQLAQQLDSAFETSEAQAAQKFFQLGQNGIPQSIEDIVGKTKEFTPVQPLNELEAFYRDLQLSMITGDYAAVEAALAQRIAKLMQNEMQNASANAGSAHSWNPELSSLLTFSAVLAFYYHPSSSVAHPISGLPSEIIESFIHWCIQHGKHNLVALFTQFLPVNQRIPTFSGFLHRLDNVEQRKNYLNQARKYFPEQILEITKSFVDSVVSHATPAMQRGYSVMANDFAAITANGHTNTNTVRKVGVGLDALLTPIGAKSARKPPFSLVSASKSAITKRISLGSSEEADSSSNEDLNADFFIDTMEYMLPTLDSLDSIHHFPVDSPEYASIHALDCFNYDSASAATLDSNFNYLEFLEAFTQALKLFRSFFSLANYGAAHLLMNSLREKRFEAVLTLFQAEMDSEAPDSKRFPITKGELEVYQREFHCWRVLLHVLHWFTVFSHNSQPIQPLSDWKSSQLHNFQSFQEAIAELLRFPSGWMKIPKDLSSLPSAIRDEQYPAEFPLTEIRQRFLPAILAIHVEVLEKCPVVPANSSIAAGLQTKAGVGVAGLIEFGLLWGENAVSGKEEIAAQQWKSVLERISKQWIIREYQQDEDEEDMQSEKQWDREDETARFSASAGLGKSAMKSSQFGMSGPFTPLSLRRAKLGSATTSRRFGTGRK